MQDSVQAVGCGGAAVRGTATHLFASWRLSCWQGGRNLAAGRGDSAALLCRTHLASQQQASFFIWPLHTPQTISDEFSP